MGRIISIDYGLKRTGLAVTDPFQIIATGLPTIASSELISFLKTYLSKETVDEIIIGEPRNLDNSDTHASEPVRAIIKRLKKEFPTMPLTTVDERYTSKLASRAMIEMGMKKMQRRQKGLVDEIAATMMLQEYMKQKSGEY